jgi:hypothetical protein
MTGLALVDAQPAAASLRTFVTPASWAYTDSHTPLKSYVDTAGDAPIGAWHDTAGKLHKSRSYFTFDLSAYRGKRIVSATAVAKETSANDCTKPRTWELWTTDGIKPTTSWANPPRQQTKLADIGGLACPSDWIGQDLTAAISDAVANQRWTLTLELRVPHKVESNVQFGRRIQKTFGISIEANTAPDTPADLTIEGKSCAGNDPIFIRTTRPQLRAKVTDPDVSPSSSGDSLTATFAAWPVDRPAERVETDVWATYAPATAWGGVPDGFLKEGGTYAWAVRTRDDRDSSPWSAECRFTVDTVRPDKVPTVASTDYPAGWNWPGSGGPGIAGKFTFTANGVADVAGYLYGIDSAYTYVAADSLGGSATADVTPSRSGSQRLNVHSVDRAGNVSDGVDYDFLVRNTAPLIDDANPDAWAGDPRPLTFRPSMENVASYTYRVDDGTAQTVAAGPDGTATITVMPNIQGSTVHVFSTTASGQKSGENWISLFVGTGPFITSEQFPDDGTQAVPVGTPGTFTFKPHMHGVVEYVYQFNRYQEDEQPAQTVRAGADGSVTIPFTATRSGYNTLSVFSRTADGTESEENGIAFYPASIAPAVNSTTYPQSALGGGPGVPGTFTFRPAVPGVVEYSYQFGDEPERTVAAAAADGSATVDWTPLTYNSEFGGWITLLVRSHGSNGLVSDPAYYQFQVDGLAPTVMSDIHGIGQPATLTFTARLGGSVEIVYNLDGDPDQTVSVTDGKATVTWTPSSAYWHSVTVRSRTASGLVSGSGDTSLWVNP